MTLPSCCDEAIRARLSQFSRKHGISGRSPLYPFFRKDLDDAMPGLFDLVENPEKWIGAIEAPWFPVSPERVINQKVFVEIVIAPLPFVAAIVRVTCPTCGQTCRIVHIGANFFVLTSHLAAHLVDRGLSSEELVDFALELHRKSVDWMRFPAPEAVPRDIVTYGMAWLMCHEIGHFASPESTQLPDDVGVPEFARPRLAEEANADRMAFCIMLHRIMAMSPYQSEKAGAALAGAFLVLNTWNLLIPSGWGRQSDITAYGPRVGGATPSPTLRWRALRDLYDAMIRMGFVLDHFTDLKRQLFSRHESRIDQLQRLLDQRRASMSMSFPEDLESVAKEELRDDAELRGELERGGEESAGLLLNVRATPADEDEFSETDYWQALKREFREFLCSDSKKYKEARELLKSTETVTSKAIVPAIAGAIGATIGLAPAILTPFVALLILGALKIGVNAWCSLEEPR